MGARLTQATRPSDGLAWLRGGGYDAVILDEMLPEMDGFEVCRAIPRDSDVPVIMLTARGEVMDRVVGLALGANDCLPGALVDRARVRLLLRNLLDNALRHGAGAYRSPELMLSRVADVLVIEVRDHGPGVPGEQLARLAQAFYRPDSARTRAAGGVGLGLYLCRLVAQAHGGRLALSDAQPGLRVRVELPLTA